MGDAKVTAVHTELLILESLTDDNAGKLLALPKMTYGPDDSNSYTQWFTRTQFPVRVSVVIMINNAQRQFSGAVGLTLNYTVFFLGELYIGLSKATNAENLKVCPPPNSNSRTKNYYILKP